MMIYSKSASTKKKGFRFSDTVFWCLQRLEEGCIGNEWVKKKRELQNYFSIQGSIRSFKNEEKILLNDFKYLTNFNDTGTLEVYHSLYSKYFLKWLHFLHNGMIACFQLAVVDFIAVVD